MSTETRFDIPDAVLAQMSARIAVHYGVVPLRLEDGCLVVAMTEPARTDVLDELALALERPVAGERAAESAIKEAIRAYYGVGADTLETLVQGATLNAETADVVEAGLDEDPGAASIVKFVNQLIVDAYASRATDVHLEPFENKLRVRYRIDGILFDAAIPESIRHFREAIASRIKIMANMDIAERRLPQDGRIRARIGSKDFDLRVSVIPIAHGESVNIRILQRSNVLMGLEAIGFGPRDLERFELLLRRPHGIVLLTGPTGSGKTTTLYACLNRINKTDRKIITVEDPVEYQIEGICQMQVRSDIGFTFARGLRSMLRHDPDVMMVGEIRDFETAELAIRCALTGHLVFSTLHTNDAAGAAPRLVDIGIEPYLLASSVEASIAQRLVRTICPHCAAPDIPAHEALVELGVDPGTVDASGLRRGSGCDECRGSGYYGRMAIYEMLMLDDDIRQLIMDQAPASRIKREAVAKGMETLRANGWAQVSAGVTTIDEVLRVTQDDREVQNAEGASASV